MKQGLAVVLVCVLLFGALVQGVSARELCVTESVACTRATGLRSPGMADPAAAADTMARRRSLEADSSRLTGMAAYYSSRAAWGQRADSARYQALADHYAGFAPGTETMARERGLAGLYGR